MANHKSKENFADVIVMNRYYEYVIEAWQTGSVSRFDAHVSSDYMLGIL